MDIEKQYKTNKLYKTNAGSYNIESCRWKVIGTHIKKKKEISNPKTRGYIHSSVLLRNSIFIIVGPEEAQSQSTMHSFNLKSYEWKVWSACSLPKSKDSFGLTVHQNQMYMFGGSNNDCTFNDLHCFNTLDNEWKQVDGGCEIEPRNPMIFSDIGNEYILLVGGVNVQTGHIFNDAFVLIGKKWLKIKNMSGAPLNLIGAKVTVSEDQIFLFGGQYQDQSGQYRSNSKLYRLRIDLSQSLIEFVEIVVNSSKAPCPRTAHCMLGLSKDYFVLVGGQSTLSNRLLRDIWIFDIEMKEWTQVNPANGPIKPVSENSLIASNNSIYIFGGLTEQSDMWNEQILTIEFGSNQLYKSQICSNCIQRSFQQERQERSFPKTIIVSSGFFYTISLEIKHPFQAMQMLWDCSAYLRASYFKISIEKSLNENEYIEMLFDGSTLDKSQFEELICHSNTGNEQFSKFMTNLKIASMRLGKTMIFITADETYRKVFLFSADSKVAPAFDENYGYFAYVENIKKNMIESHEGKAHRNLILNVLRSRVEDPQKVLNEANLNKLLIFEKNILVTSDKVYYYEVISSNEDISVYKSIKKVQFLDQLGYKISKEPEISLSSYLANSRLNFETFPTIYVNKCQEGIKSFLYLEKLLVLEKAGSITQFEIYPKQSDLEIESSVFVAVKSAVIANNQGILIYYNGSLVNRLDVNFGDLFKEQFYKTKFKHAETLFQFMGVINIKKGLTLNYFGSWFKKNKNYYLFIENLREAMRKARLDLTDQKDDNEERKVSKRGRT